jgi:hypothetical protein
MTFVRKLLATDAPAAVVLIRLMRGLPTRPGAS